MNITKIAITALFTLSLTASAGLAQERLASVGSYPALQQKQTPSALKSALSDTLSLPFLDDFSNPSVYPDSSRWINGQVYINNSFGYHQPTYGVATFDAMDSTGAIYKTATVESFPADELTSRAINLFLPADTTVYLSFYYQPQGLGDAPEPEDSLVLEFYAPDLKQWDRVWSAPGSGVTDFKLTMINITDSRYLQDGFRFRFRNYASLAPAYEPSLKVNADHWNLDYVYLNNGRHFNDTVMQDASLLRSTGSLLLNYTSIPWEHFKTVGISAVKAIFPVNLNNLSPERRFFSPRLTITPLWATGAVFVKDLAQDEVKAFESLNYDAAFNYGFSANGQDSALFRITLDMNQTTSDWIPGNDSIVSEQLFSDYYAYDDGTAEAGYGLVGEGAKTGKVACRFTNLGGTDSLRAVDFYFNQSFDNASRKYFRLAIWADDNGSPGELIFTQDGGIPYYDGINRFQRMVIDSALFVQGTYYVGWMQTTADFLNIGFDRQNNHQDDLFYNLNGTWVNSSFEGTVMIRPVFTNKSLKTSSDGSLFIGDAGLNARTYPNPANDRITVETDEPAGNLRVSLFDLNGRMVRDLVRTGPTVSMDVAAVPNGLYFIQIRTDSGRISRQKLIVVHE
jgi:hypothetical protein